LCILGDFNAIKKLGERKGLNSRGSNKSEMNEFNEFIEKNELFDLPLVGGKYT